MGARLPQLLDRFGLCVDVEGIRDPDQRVLIAERDEAFRRNDPDFLGEFREADDRLAVQLAEAIDHASTIAISPSQARLISSICIEAQVAGHRADVVIERAARSVAAYRGHSSPTRDDIYDAAELALTHR